jgi:hypothetical protein
MNLLAEDDDDSDMEDVFAPPKNPVNPEKRLKEMVADAIARLKQEGLVEETDDGELETTSYGDMLCSYSIRFGTFLSLKNMDPGATPPQLVSMPNAFGAQNNIMLMRTLTPAARSHVQSYRIQGPKVPKW